MADNSMGAEAELMDVAKGVLARWTSVLATKGWKPAGVETDVYECEGRCVELHTTIDGPQRYAEVVLVHLIVEADRPSMDADGVRRALEADLSELVGDLPSESRRS